MDIKQEYLPIIETDINSFLSLNQDKNEDRINMLVGKSIIFEFKDKEGIMTLPGKLLEYKDNYLLIRQYDDGTIETKELWTNYDGSDLFKDFEEKIYIDNIKSIEEYKKYNPNIKFKDEYKNCICEITNKDNITIPVIIRSFDGFELEFDFKYKNDDGIFISTYSYPLYFIENIKIKKN